MTTTTEDAFHTRYTISLDEPVGSLTISPRNRDACLAARKGLFIIDLEAPYSEPLFLPHAAAWEVADVQWSPHPCRAQWIASAAGQNALIWNLDLASSSSSPIQHVLRGHNRSVTDINFSTFDPNALATVSLDGSIHTWDLRTDGRRPHLSYNAWHIGGTQVKFNRQDPNILASAHDSCVYVWDHRNGSAPLAKVEAHAQRCYGLDWDRKKADEFSTCSLDKTIKTWSYKTPGEPINTIKMNAPVWRARHLPFGDGLLALPQRNDPALSIFTKKGTLVEQLGGHLKSTVKEFVWRTRGGADPSHDDREFQLITWGKDRMLRMWPISNATLHAVGHVHGAPIPIRVLLDEKANYDSFRVMPPKRSTLSVHHPESKSGSVSSMTPPSRNLVGSLGSSKRGSMRSARYLGAGGGPGGAGAGGESSASGASLGTSPISDPDLFATSKSADDQPSSGPTRNNKRAGFAVAKTSLAPQYMSGRPAGGRHKNAASAMAWMEGVQKEESETKGHGLSQTPQTTDFLPDNRPARLQDEFAQVSRKFSGKVMFERMNVSTGHIQLACYGPWGVGGSPCFIKAYFSFPPRYPQQRAAVSVDKHGEVTLRQRALLLTGLRAATKRCADRCEPCLDTCIAFLLHRPGNVFEPVISSESEEEDAQQQQQRNAVPLPRRSGAIFGPNDTLICFFPTDSTAPAPNRAESVERSRPGARRGSNTAVLFDTFGSIPLSQGPSTVPDEDESDEALRIPRGMGRATERSTTRSASRGRAAPTLPSSTKIHFKSLSSLTPVDVPSLPPSILTDPSEVAHHQFSQAQMSGDALKASIWAMMYQFYTGSVGQPASIAIAPFAQFLSEAVAALQRLRDLQSLGLLACSLEMFMRNQRMRAIELATEQRSQPLEPSQLATDQRKKSTAITNVSKPKKLRVKITTHAPTLADLPKSLTSQLEQHRFAFAHCLYRLDIPYLRAEVLALTMAARRSRNLTTSGLAEAVGLLGASLEFTAGSRPARCVICQKSCRGLTLGCLKCLHGGHSECMQAWFVRSDQRCPAGSCDCMHECATI